MSGQRYKVGESVARWKRCVHTRVRELGSYAEKGIGRKAKGRKKEGRYIVRRLQVKLFSQRRPWFINHRRSRRLPILLSSFHLPLHFSPRKSSLRFLSPLLQPRQRTDQKHRQQITRALFNSSFLLSSFSMKKYPLIKEGGSLWVDSSVFFRYFSLESVEYPEQTKHYYRLSNQRVDATSFVLNSEMDATFLLPSRIGWERGTKRFRAP